MCIDIHTVNLWMREDGAQIDRVLLTTSSTYVPSGNGPAESPRSLNARQVLAEAAPKVLYKIHVARSTQLLTPGAGQTYRISYYAGTRLIAIREVGVRNSLQFIHTDHLGSVSVASNLAGAQVGTTQRYYPFGRLRPGSGAQWFTDAGFTGQIADAGTGLMYYNARYYSPYLNRFISADPIISDARNSQALNRYSYVVNNPLTYVDPSGNRHCTPSTCGQKRSDASSPPNLCQQMPMVCQANPDAQVESPLVVNSQVLGRLDSPTFVPIGPAVAMAEIENEVLLATTDNQSSKSSRTQSALDTLRRLIGLPTGEAVRQLCVNDGDCSNEVTTAVRNLQRAQGYGPGTTVAVGYLDDGTEFFSNSADTLGRGFQRVFDCANRQAWAHAESQVLEKFARYLLSLGDPSKLTGRIRLFTVIEPCGTCNNVIAQFRLMFPNIELYVYYLIPYVDRATWR